jgi:hypothetical protein
MNVIVKNVEARAYVAAIANERVRRAVEFGTSLAVRVAMDEKEHFIHDSDAVPIDLLVYAKLLRRLFEREGALARAQAGEPDEWGPT